MSEERVIYGEDEFYEAWWSDQGIDNTTIVGVTISDQYMWNTEVECAKFIDVVIEGTEIETLSFKGCTFENIIFRGSKLVQVDIEGCSATRFQIETGEITDMYFSSCTVQKLVISECSRRMPQKAPIDVWGSEFGAIVVRDSDLPEMRITKSLVRKLRMFSSNLPGSRISDTLIGAGKFKDCIITDCFLPDSTEGGIQYTDCIIRPWAWENRKPSSEIETQKIAYEQYNPDKGKKAVCVFSNDDFASAVIGNNETIHPIRNSWNPLW